MFLALIGTLIYAENTDLFLNQRNQRLSASKIKFGVNDI